MKTITSSWKAPLRNIYTGKRTGRSTLNTCTYHIDSEIAVLRKRYFIDWKPSHDEEILKKFGKWLYVETLSTINLEAAKLIIELHIKCTND